jgi:hypothetical protein
MFAAMTVDSRHPEYEAAAPQWSRARNVLLSEDAAMAAAVKYLPRMDSQSDEEYAAYKARASFFGATARTLEEYPDLIFRTAPVLDVADSGELAAFVRNGDRWRADFLRLTDPPRPSLARLRIFLVVQSMGKHYCLVDMDNHAQGMHLYTVRNSVAGERDHLGRWGWCPRQPLPPPMLQATPRCFHLHPDHRVMTPDSGGMPDELPVSGEQTVRICTTLHYFAPLCSDFAARSQPESSENQSVLLPTTWTHSRSQTVPITFPISVQFRSSFGLVSTGRPAWLRRRLKPQISVKKPPAFRFPPGAFRLALSALRLSLPASAADFKGIQGYSKDFKGIQTKICAPPIHPSAPQPPSAWCRFRLPPSALRFPLAAFRFAHSFLGHRK